VTLPLLYSESGEPVPPPALHLVGGVFVPKGGVAIRVLDTMHSGYYGIELIFPVDRKAARSGLTSFPWPGWKAVQVDGIRALHEFIALNESVGTTFEEDAKAFAERYGPLYIVTHRGQIVQWQGTPAGRRRQSPRWEGIEDLGWWFSEIRRLTGVLAVAAALRQGVEPKAEHVRDAGAWVLHDDYGWGGELVRWAREEVAQAGSHAPPPAFYDELRKKMFSSWGLYEPQGSVPFSGSPQDFYAALVSSALTLRLRRLGVVVTVSNTMPFQPEFFTGLGILPILWQQAAAVISGGRSLALCSVCGLPYVRRQRAPRRGANNYCSNCSGSGSRQRLHRRRKETGQVGATTPGTARPSRDSTSRPSGQA